MSDPSPDLTTLSAQVTAAYLANNTVSASDVPSVIQAVYGAFAGLGTSQAAPEAERLVPAVPIKKSVTPDHIVCLEDGKKLKMLKRHLQTAFGMTPEEYRARWGLPLEYPMVAPNYAAQRSSLAKQIGLGTGAKKGSVKARRA